MKTKLVLMIAIINLALSSIAQKQPAKKDLQAIFKKVYRDQKMMGISKYPEWSICNSDSSFYKKDTIELISDNVWFLNNGCCETINLAFHSEKKFFMNAIHGCKEVSSVSTVGTNNNYSLSFYSDNAATYIVFTDQKKKLKFKALGIDSLKPFYKKITTIRLLRIQ